MDTTENLEAVDQDRRLVGATASDAVHPFRVNFSDADMSAGYGQFCPIAKAAEIFATRWTPLILRELMSGVHSFNDIARGVPLISRAVLVARLRELEKHGIIERRARAEERGHEYWLAPAGEDFRAVAVGRSPHHYVSAKRLELAKQLLGKGGQPLVDIALTLQFSCQANFTRAFREATGQTPAQYRRSVGMIAAEPAAKIDNS